MRDIKRLFKIYDVMFKAHKDYFPDWRMMQLLLNFISWHVSEYKTDGFYIEDETFINRFKEYVDRFKDAN